MSGFPDFVVRMAELRLKRKGRTPKFSPQRLYPARIERKLAELLDEELSDMGDRLRLAAGNGHAWAQDEAEDVVRTDTSIPPEFHSRLLEIAGEIVDFNTLAFADLSELTVGERYFATAADKERIVSAWTENFLTLCRSANEEMKKKVSMEMARGVMEGRSIRDVAKDVRNICSAYTKGKSELIARTETGKLNTAIARNQMESAGVEYYEWGASMDGRTRASHAAMDGRICKWGDDTHWYSWIEEKSGKKRLVRRDRPKGAYHGAPGTDFQCRCVAMPYVPEFEGEYEKARETGAVQDVTQNGGYKRTPPKTAENGDLKAELEKAKAVAAEREKGLQTALKKAERKAEILRKANGRHAARTSADIDAIKTKAWKREMPKDMTDEAKEAMAKNWLEIERELGIKKGRRMSVAEADMQKANPNYSKAEEFQNNCQTCVPTYMLRLWGFDVKAKGCTSGSLSEWIARQHSFDIWENADGSKANATYYLDFMKAKGYKKITREMYAEFFDEACDVEGVYVATVAWHNKDSGHATVLQRLKDGRLVRVEPQKFTGIDETDVFRLVAALVQKCERTDKKRLEGRGVMRIDDKILKREFLSIFTT